MSATSVKMVEALPQGALAADPRSPQTDSRPKAAGNWRKLFAVTGWRRQVVETVLILAFVAMLQRSVFGFGEIPGFPHPYWIPVLLASSQYGLAGGVLATVAAFTFYVAGLSPPSAAQDFYTYARAVAVQPAAWLATALALGGLRDLHRTQIGELVEALALSRQQASDLTEGLRRATSEVDACERRIALDSRTVASLTRSLLRLDMSSREAVASSFSELFRVGASVGTFTIYLFDGRAYAPAATVEDHGSRPPHMTPPLSPETIDRLAAETRRQRLADESGKDAPAGRRTLVSPPLAPDARPQAAIVCEVQSSTEPEHFHRRAEEMTRLLATLLHASAEAAADEPT